MALYSQGSSSKATPRAGTSEFDILKASHKFLREDDKQSELSWDEQLAKKYYQSLYREFAVCDLKHYKSGNFSLRWRTESEVISGAGETTCGNTRCPLHTESGMRERTVTPSLQTLELPFSYIEEGENKFALVKVVLCAKCQKKLVWKRTKEREEEKVERKEREEGEDEDIQRAGVLDRQGVEQRADSIAEELSGGTSSRVRRNDRGQEASRHSDHKGDIESARQSRRRSSRSRSPRRHSGGHHRGRP
ncbi:hypothetical protein SCP_1201010 [Sparassis crispa]|uniref:Protein FRA10AC1 n=1 Tax=Sparassis crispa TaxID=139825 RepID=A0A401H0B8_9APHY|nr:hypothetical protein SCP_1201010 [Sparassis crispa]GBE87876.1 hypothetical protein SCP_1201010 [Sparassis crispa]